MYKIGDYIIYSKEVCKIEDIKLNFRNNIDYYILIPVNDQSLKLSIPVTTKQIQELISKEEVNRIINNIKDIEIINEDDKMIEYEYKRLLNTKNHEDLVKIIKTTYLRNKKRIENKKKISDKDKNYFEKAESYLYTEFSIVLDMPYNETKKYVIQKVLEGIENDK